MEKLASEVHIVPEEFGFFALKSENLMGKRMFYHDELGVETEPAKGVATGAIAVVACHRVMRCGELRADLVLSAGFQREFEECVAG